jgi:hypothetical protein
MNTLHQLIEDCFTDHLLSIDRNDMMEAELCEERNFAPFKPTLKSGLLQLLIKKAHSYEEAECSWVKLTATDETGRDFTFVISHSTVFHIHEDAPEADNDK